jgi:carbamate kinase
MVLVTGVAGVYRDFGIASAALLRHATPRELEALAAGNQFPAGSMGPKVEAAIRFARGSGRPAIICRPADLAAAIVGEAGTVVSEKD